MKLTDEELDAILGQGGLLLNQEHSPRKSYRKDAYLFTTCTHCGIEAHYRLQYVLGKMLLASRSVAHVIGENGTVMLESSTIPLFKR